MLVSVDDGRHNEVRHRARTHHVVGIHDNGILCDPFPDRQVSGFFPIHVGKDGLGTRTVSMYDIAETVIATQVVGVDLAEGVGEEPLVYIGHCLVNIVFCSGDAALIIPFGIAQNNMDFKNINIRD